MESPKNSATAAEPSTNGNFQSIDADRSDPFIQSNNIDAFEGTEAHRLRMEAELLTIESQFLRSTRHEHDRLQREINSLTSQLEAARHEIHRLRAAEHHLRRLLTMVNGSPIGYVARRKWGFRKMVDEWL